MLRHAAFYQFQRGNAVNLCAWDVPNFRGLPLKAGALALVLSAGASAESFKYESSSNFGPDDTLGAANHLGEAQALAASRLVREGKTYALGMVSSGEVPVWGERKFAIEVVGIPVSPDSPAISAHDDRLLTHVGIGTQIDGLGHVGIDGVFYNGARSSDFFAPDGLRKLGAEHIPPIVTRGVLLDIAGHLEKTRLDPGKAIGVDLIKAVAKRQGVVIRKGDVVLLHTGWMSMAAIDGKQFIERQPGIDLAAARHLAELGVVAIGSDTGALEVQPSRVASHPYPVHGLLLANYGVYILENIVTRDLAADRAWEFMFVLGQPRFAGSVQAVINPIAIR
jgi:kynurenine formamidase